MAPNQGNPWKMGCIVKNAREQVSGTFSKENPPKKYIDSIVISICFHLSFFPRF